MVVEGDVSAASSAAEASAATGAAQENHQPPSEHGEVVKKTEHHEHAQKTAEGAETVDGQTGQTKSDHHHQHKHAEGHEADAHATEDATKPATAAGAVKKTEGGHQPHQNAGKHATTEHAKHATTKHANHATEHAAQHSDQPPPLPDGHPARKPPPPRTAKVASPGGDPVKRGSASLTAEQIDTIRRQSLQFRAVSTAASQRQGSRAGSLRASSSTARGSATLPVARSATQRRAAPDDRRSSARSSGGPVVARASPAEVRSATLPPRRGKKLQQPATAKPQEMYHQQQHSQRQLYQQHVEQAQLRSRDEEKRPQPVGRDSSPEKEKKGWMSSWFDRPPPPQPRRKVTYGKSVEELAVQRRSMVSIPQPWMERLITLCKDKDGKVGLRCQAINKGVFVVLVQKNSPAAMSGLRFGDQILQINDESVAGYSMDKVHEIFRKARSDAIKVAVRDRPFERTVTMHKDSAGTVGFQYREGKIMTLVKDSSAARNGLLIDHHLLEINGQNVVGLKDKETKAIIDECGSVVTVTVMPSFVYEHMMKKVHSSIIEKLMDHSIPDF